MKILSVNVAQPLDVNHNGKLISTAIFKKPITGSVYVSKYNIEGDRQADLKNHGGEHKAVYAYSHDHFNYWRELLDKQDMPYGQFGENLTVSGLDESTVCIGDHLQAGSCLFTITQPRVPCFKLGIKFNNKDMPRLFTQAALTGIYLQVLKEGHIESGNTIAVVKRGNHQLSVKNLFSAFFNTFFHINVADATNVLKCALEIPELSIEWQNKIKQKLNKIV